MEIWILGVAPRYVFFSNTTFLRFISEKLEPAKRGIFKTPILCGILKKWDPDIFPKSQIFKISCSSHSENVHIKLSGFQSWFGGWGDMPFIFFMGWMLRFGRNLGFRTTTPSCLSTWVGLLAIRCVLDYPLCPWPWVCWWRFQGGIRMVKDTTDG